MTRPEPAALPPVGRRSRTIPLLLLPLLPWLLGGCEAALGAASGPSLVLGGASVVLTGRTPVDHVASLATGRDCSAVRLERGQAWCAPPPRPPPASVYCTRSLGAADCWTAPPLGAGRQVADPPAW
jgi:hypothetical protein